METDQYCCHGKGGFSNLCKKKQRWSPLPLAEAQCFKRSHLSNTETLTFAPYICTLIFIITIYILLLVSPSTFYISTWEKSIIDHPDIADCEWKHVAVGGELGERAQQSIWRNSQNWWGWSLFNTFLPVRNFGTFYAILGAPKMAFSVLPNLGKNILWAT